MQDFGEGGGGEGEGRAREKFCGAHSSFSTDFIEN